MSRPYTGLDGISCRGGIYAALLESGTETGLDNPFVQGA